MAAVYHEEGETFYDTFTHLDEGGSAVTGLTSGSFTVELSKEGTGNQSTTRITVAEIDSTNKEAFHRFKKAGDFLRQIRLI